MKFRDIPQFPSARWAVDVPWTHLEDNLETIRGGGELRLDPDYQRAHVWTREQQVAYVEFQLMGGGVSRTLIFNAPHWGQYGVVAADTYVELLDGKQRLEAVRAFLRGDFPVFGTQYRDFEDKLPTMEYRLRFQICSLETRESVLQLYLKINAGGTPHSAAELARVREAFLEAYDREMASARPEYTEHATSIAMFLEEARNQ